MPADMKSPGAPPIIASTEFGSHLPTSWMCRPWKPGRQDVVRGRLHGDGGVSIGEFEGGGGHRPAIGGMQLRRSGFEHPPGQRCVELAVDDD